MIYHPNKSRSGEPAKPKYGRSKQHDIFDKRVIIYWTLFRTWPTWSCDYNELISIHVARGSWEYPVYRKIPGNYLINSLLFPTSSSSTKTGLWRAKKGGETSTGRAPTTLWILISNSKCMKLQQGQTKLPLLVGPSKVCLLQGEDEAIIWKCEAFCYDFSAQPCCLHQGERRWIPGDALLLQCT